MCRIVIFRREGKSSHVKSRNVFFSLSLSRKEEEEEKKSQWILNVVQYVSLEMVVGDGWS
jgi:hypothetical protein